MHAVCSFVDVLKLIVPFLHWRVQLQHRAGIRKDASSHATPSLTSFASIVSGARMLGRFWGEHLECLLLNVVPSTLF